MYSKTSTGKASKGSVSVLSSNSRLQLRFNYGGKRHYISTGLADRLANRKLAEFRAAEIEKDILFERFDPTLEKYNPRSVLSTVTPITPIQKLQPKLDELWDKYTEFKKPQVSPSTYAKDFIKHRNHIAKLPSRSLDDASGMRDYLLSTLTPDSAKRCLTQIKACCNWAMEEGTIATNPFVLMKIKLPKGLSEKQDVNPFSKEERDLIIQTFEGDRHYCYYTNYVRFLCVEAHINSTAIGRWTGTSAKMIDNHYGATNFTNLRPPNLS